MMKKYFALIAVGFGAAAVGLYRMFTNKGLTTADEVETVDEAEVVEVDEGHA